MERCSQGQKRRTAQVQSSNHTSVHYSKVTPTYLNFLGRSSVFLSQLKGVFESSCCWFTCWIRWRCNQLCTESLLPPMDTFPSKSSARLNWISPKGQTSFWMFASRKSAGGANSSRRLRQIVRRGRHKMSRLKEQRKSPGKPEGSGKCEGKSGF